MAKKLKAKQKLGKYKIERVLADGGFARVYRARDTIEGTKVALKIPHQNLMSPQALEIFKKEVRLTARLDHPNILPLKNANFIDDMFVITIPLAQQTLEQRLRTRLSLKTALEYTEQILEGLAEAHSESIIHCDMKPENILLFPENRLRITDFGIARVARRTLMVSGSGTLGYIAPEQAMGKASFASDVFSTGLVLWRMFSGKLPEWPFRQPLPGYERLRKRLHPNFVAFLLRAIDTEPSRRFPDAGAMLRAFQRLKPSALKRGDKKKKQQAAAKARQKNDWRFVLFKQFQREFGKQLESKNTCARCSGPIAETMQHCPWCGHGVAKPKFKGTPRFPYQCPRCERGVKADWKFCPHCYGGAIGPQSNREFSDRRYTGRCSNTKCGRKTLMPFMRYCPWCNRKVRKPWTIAGSRDRCKSCGWGVLGSFWKVCPWCKTTIRRG